MRPTLAWLASALLAHAPLLACRGGDERRDGAAHPNASATASAGSAPDSGADAAHDAGPDPALGPPCVEPFVCTELDCADYVPQESRSTCTAGNPQLDCDFSVDGECGRYVIRAAGNSWHYRVHYWDRESGQIVGRGRGTDFLAYCDNQHFSVFSGEADAYTTCYAAVQSAIACGFAAWPCDQLAR